MPESSTTLDGLLNRRVQLEQPASGYRVAIDTVLLAAAVPAMPDDEILDLGCGVGGAMLCLAARIPGIKGLGLELQPELVTLCARNIARNPFASNLKVEQGDATTLPVTLRSKFTQVLMNPPYHEDASHDTSPNKIKRTANTEKQGDLPAWIASAQSALKEGGTLTLIHRADRREEILNLLQPSFGGIEILPLLPKKGNPPKRLIIRARLNAPAKVHESNSLVLHSETGAYTEAAERVLRHGEPLN